MRKVVLMLMIMALAYLSYAQGSEQVTPSKFKYGFNLGVGYSMLSSAHELTKEQQLENGSSFQLGIIMEYQLNNWFSLAPKAEIAFNDTRYIKKEHTIEDVYPATINLNMLAKFKLNSSDMNPYILVGPEFKQPLKAQSKTTTEFTHGSTMAVNLALGIDKKLKYFTLAPEIRYSYGLTNINSDPELESLYLHNLSLVLGFI